MYSHFQSTTWCFQLRKCAFSDAPASPRHFSMNLSLMPWCPRKAVMAEMNSRKGSHTSVVLAELSKAFQARCKGPDTQMARGKK